MSIKISFLCLFSVLLTAASLLSGCGTPAEIPPETVTETADVTENKYTWSGANYTFDGTKITAAVCAPTNFDQVFSGAFYEDPLLDGDFAAEVEVTLDSLYASGGLLFRASASDTTGGYEGSLQKGFY